MLDRGRIVEDGSHEDLMRRDGLYAELFTLQAAAYLSEELGTARTIEAVSEIDRREGAKFEGRTS